MKIRSIPFGYRMELGEIVAHPEEAAVLRQIFALYIDGLGYKAIVKKLNTSSICYHPDATWNQHMVKRILENRSYLGENNYPALISPSDFDAVAAQKAKIPQCKQQRRRKAEPDFSFLLLPYTPSAKARRLTNEINRELERTPAPGKVKPLIFACAAEKYASIGVERNG